MQGKESYRKVCEDRKVSDFRRRLGSSSVIRSRPTAGAKLVKQESKWYLAQKQGTAGTCQPEVAPAPQETFRLH